MSYFFVITTYIHMYNNSDIVARICRISGMEGGTLLFHMIQE
uniref:Uncharacterized protein n=1 Tax=Klebsiella pneumoniae TaxID=573 RepID=A0A8B0SU81_KLEPN|nr:hypothetical protein [Klebsiella pneumoniae]